MLKFRSIRTLGVISALFCQLGIAHAATENTTNQLFENVDKRAGTEAMRVLLPEDALWAHVAVMGGNIRTARALTRVCAGMCSVLNEPCYALASNSDANISVMDLLRIRSQLVTYDYESRSLSIQGQTAEVIEEGDRLCARIANHPTLTVTNFYYCNQEQAKTLFKGLNHVRGLSLYDVKEDISGVAIYCFPQLEELRINVAFLNVGDVLPRSYSSSFCLQDTFSQTVNGAQCLKKFFLRTGVRFIETLEHLMQCAMQVNIDVELDLCVLPLVPVPGKNLITSESVINTVQNILPNTPNLRMTIRCVKEEFFSALHDGFAEKSLDRLVVTNELRFI